MKVRNQQLTTIWIDDADRSAVHAIDQRLLPHRLEIAQLKTPEDVFDATRDMLIRGAPLIGVAAAYGLYLAAREAIGDEHFQRKIEQAYHKLLSARPTAVNLKWALDQQMERLRTAKTAEQACLLLLDGANMIREGEIAISKNIGQHGLTLITELARTKKRFNILTHCNAGWLCSVDWGTATAPIYAAHESGIDVHVWVDETRPRNQGAALTAWELGEHGVPYTLIADNTGGHLMQHGLVDMVIVGTDRTAANGDVANKIGTYLKALAAHDNQVPFYVAAPSSSIDWTLPSGDLIPIEQRDADEVKYVHGLNDEGKQSRVLVSPPEAPAANYGFDVTPARLITGIITERGTCAASEAGLRSLFPELERSLQS